MTLVTGEVAEVLVALGFEHQARQLAVAAIDYEDAVAVMREIGDDAAQECATAIEAGVKDKYRVHRLTRWAPA